VSAKKPAILIHCYSTIGCPTRYRTGCLADRCSLSQQIGALQTHTTDTFLFISHTTNVLLFKFRCKIFIGVRIIKEMRGSVASGTYFITKILCKQNLGRRHGQESTRRPDLQLYLFALGTGWAMKKSRKGCPWSTHQRRWSEKPVRLSWPTWSAGRGSTGDTMVCVQTCSTLPGAPPWLHSHGNPGERINWQYWSRGGRTCEMATTCFI